MLKPYVFYIRGMTCGGCPTIIESFLKEAYAGKLKHFTVDITLPDPKKSTVYLTDVEGDHRIIWEQLKEQIEEIGYNCESYDYTPPKDHPSQREIEPLSGEETPAPETDLLTKIINWTQDATASHWVLGTIGCTAGIALLIATLALGGLPLAAMIPLAGVSTLLTFALGSRSYYEAWNKLVHSRTLTMDTLFAVSTLTVLVVSIASFFVPWLPMMFEVGLLIYGFRHIGIAIENTLKEKISSAQFQDRAPKVVNLVSENEIIRQPLYQINPGDILRIYPGEIIPLDGVCAEGGLIYTTIKNGAILPSYNYPGDEVLAGMRLAENATPITIIVNKAIKDSHLARLDAGISQSRMEKAPLEIKTEQVLTYFIPTVIGLAITSGIVISFFFPAALAIQCAISVLVSACPCTLGLIIPLAVKTGTHKAAENGVQFKNSKALQQAEQVDTVIFDLNGTLTEGAPKIKHYSVLPDTGLSPSQFLNLCGSLEESSVHPIGKAIYSYAQQNGPQILPVTAVNDAHHSGITGTIDDEYYTIGGMSLMREKGISTGAVEKLIDLEAGDSLVFVARGNQLIGYIVMSDPLRKDAQQTIKKLMEMGKEVHICTGSDEKTAARYAKALGISNIHANRVAITLDNNNHSKPAYIKLLKEQGRIVAMVGDATNDAQAIEDSHLGIAIQSQDSDELTLQCAGAIIQSGSLLPIVNAFEVSEQTNNNITQNLFLSIGYNLTSVLLAGGLLLAIGISLPPAVGVIFMAVQACSIFYNVYLFKHQPLEYLDDVFNNQKALDTAQSSLHIMRQHMPTNTPVPEYSSEPIEQMIPKKTCCSMKNTTHLTLSEEASVSQHYFGT